MKSVVEGFSKTSALSISVSMIFIVSAVSIPGAMAANSPSSPMALAAKPLSQLEANWVAGNGDQFNYDFNPQNRINSSNAQYLGISWLFPLPTHPTALLSVGGGLGVDTSPLIINGTIYFITQYAQVFALNAANGNVLWTDVLPIFPNSTAGKGIASVSLHLHDGNEAFTTKLFGGTPTFWVSAPDQHIYAINALNGNYELNFSHYSSISSIAGNNPNALYTGTSTNLLVDQNKGIVITSIMSGSSPATGRCFFRGWNVLVTPPQLMWTAFCTPPQPGGNLPVDPNWDIEQINSMKGARIFYPGPAYHNGGLIPGTAVVDLKTLSPVQLNATLYDDWGYVNQTQDCKAWDLGGSTGSTAAGWGGPWNLGVGPTSGMAFVSTNNPDPYNSPCVRGPELWSASVLALNETNGQWIWGFQSSAHDLWDLDCAWWQGLGNETISGTNTQVLWKLCKNGYMTELNAQTGSMIWAYTAPTSSVPRCPNCDMLNPLNKTQMSQPYFAPDRTGLNVGTFIYPGQTAESEASYSPTLNYLFYTLDVVPILTYYVPPSPTNYRTNSGMLWINPAGGPLNGPAQKVGNSFDNATISAVNAATGQLVWSYLIPTQSYRGGLTNSGNVVYVTLSSGDLLMLNAQTGALIKDLFIGGPLNVLPSIGATTSGVMEVIFPITAGIVSWAPGVPGDIVALTLQSLPGSTTNTVTATATTTATTTVGAGATVTTTATVTVSGSGATVTAAGASSGVSTTTLYGVAAVAVIFIIATGYLAMSRRKPAS